MRQTTAVPELPDVEAYRRFFRTHATGRGVARPRRTRGGEGAEDARAGRAGPRAAPVPRPAGPPPGWGEGRPDGPVVHRRGGEHPRRRDPVARSTTPQTEDRVPLRRGT